MFILNDLAYWLATESYWTLMLKLMRAEVSNSDVVKTPQAKTRKYFSFVFVKMFIFISSGLVKNCWNK